MLVQDRQLRCASILINLRLSRPQTTSIEISAALEAVHSSSAARTKNCWRLRCQTVHRRAGERASGREIELVLPCSSPSWISHQDISNWSRPCAVDPMRNATRVGTDRQQKLISPSDPLCSIEGLHPRRFSRDACFVFCQYPTYCFFHMIASICRTSTCSE